MMKEEEEEEKMVKEEAQVSLTFYFGPMPVLPS